MFRKLFLSAVVAVGCVTPFIAAPKVEAAHFHRHHTRYGHHHHYRVYYRANGNGPWVCYGRYDDCGAANHALFHLRQRGCEGYVR